MSSISEDDHTSHSDGQENGDRETWSLSDSDSSDDDGDDLNFYSSNGKKRCNGDEKEVQASSSKKRRPEDPDRAEREAEQSPDDAVNVDFDFSDMNESYFHSIKELFNRGALGSWRLLTRSKDGVVKAENRSAVPLSELTDTVVGQVEVGTTIVADGGEDALACISLLSFQDNKEKAFIGQLAESIIALGDKTAYKDTLHDVLGPYKSSGSTTDEKPKFFPALLVNERLLNLPPQLVPPLHGALVQDLEWARSNKTGVLEKFTHVVVLTKSFEDAAESKVRNKKGNHNTCQSRTAGQGVREGGAQSGEYYYKFEDEVLEQHADVAISSSTGEVSSSGRNERHHVFLLKKSRYLAAVKKMQDMIVM